MSAVSAELEQARVLDLFAGSGALGIEALSRGAAHATFVELAPKAIQALRANLAELRVPETSFRVVQGDALRFAERVEPGAFDIAFADPPYRKGFAIRLAELYGSHPFTSLLCLEHESDEAPRGSIVWNRRYGDTVLTFLRSADD